MSLRVAVVLYGVPRLRGGGGVERYFADLVSAFAARDRMDVRAVLCTDAGSLASLRGIGRDMAPEQLACGCAGGRFAQARTMMRELRAERFDVVHLVQALPRYLPWYWAVAGRRRSPAVALNVNDSRLSYRLNGEPMSPAMAWAEYLTYRAYLSSKRLDGLMCWYERFAKAYRERYGTDGATYVQAARHCFVDTRRFAPVSEKGRCLVWAGRLVEYKRPLLFLDALAWVRAARPEALDGWQVRMFGDGPLRNAVLEVIERHGLNGIARLDETGDLSGQLARSRAFVSTQDYENFTSLAMLEAMASGNAILARDVGQTRAFVRPGSNGLLCTGDDAAAVGNLLLAYLGQPERHSAWQRESRRITLEEHCVDNAVDEFETFWRAVHANHLRRASHG